MKSRPAIRISETDEVKKALTRAKKLYPALSDAEIFKLGLSKIAREETSMRPMTEEAEIMAAAAQAVGYDYLRDPEEDIYTEGMGKKVNFP